MDLGFGLAGRHHVGGVADKLGAGAAGELGAGVNNRLGVVGGMLGAAADVLGAVGSSRSWRAWLFLGGALARNVWLGASHQLREAESWSATEVLLQIRLTCGLSGPTARLVRVAQ